MMGHRESLSGSEIDKLTKSKRNYNHKPGTRVWAKAKVNRRSRRDRLPEYGSQDDLVYETIYGDTDGLILWEGAL